MTQADWSAVKALFERALEQPAADRAAWLAAQPADAAVRAEVASLLAHEASLSTRTGADAFLDPPPPPAGPLLPPGTRLGAWEIVGPLGAGGMAEVMRARRADGAWEGEAAVKVLKRGMDSATVLARFALEQRTLARLNHPHIAHLLDAGRNAAGLPYFVMELVEGRPIDQACQGLSLPDRLGLFLQLADAVAFAHRQLLVHRDIKPSNVLVTGDGRVKLLDFGIAKALDPGDGEHTAAGQRPFTPHYASPEQVRGEPVGTLTDIYSLGVLLYVMLTGQRPYGRGATTPQEAVRCVLEEEPTRPSALSPGLVADPNWLATRRRLAGDLDNILLKALDKDGARRYPSVDALASDVRAHLDGFPVSARPPRPGYLIGRFVRRHRAASAAAGLAVLSLAAGLGLARWQAHVAEQQRVRAEQRAAQVRQLANQLVFKYHDQIQTLPGATSVRAALLADAAAFQDSLRADLGDDPLLAEELAGVYYRIARLQGLDAAINTGEFAQAEANLDKALNLAAAYAARPEAGVPTLAAAVDIHISDAERWQRRGQLARAEASLRQGQVLLERALAQAPEDTWALAAAISLHGVQARVLGNSLSHPNLGRWRQACDSADRARDAAETTLRADPGNVYAPDSLAFTLGEQAQCRLLAGQAEEAAQLLQRQVTLRDRMAQAMPDDIEFRYQRGVARAQWARARAALGQAVPAQALLDEARRLVQAAAAADPGNAAATRRLDAIALWQAELRWRAGDRAGTRVAALAALQGLRAGPADAFGARQTRTEALLWAVRSGAARPAALLDEAQSLVDGDTRADDNASRRWLLAQIWGERARLAHEAGEAAAARAAARQAQGLWTQALPPEGLPPLLRPWADAAERLAAG
jgi:hypothetical protein